MDTEKKDTKKFQAVRSLLASIRKYLVTGTLVILPSIVTAWVLWSLFSFIDRLAKSVLGESFADTPGVGVVISIAVIILVGIFATNLIGRRMISFGEKIMARIPFANKIYMAVQQISTAFLASKRALFNKMVLVEYPRKGIYSLGLITAETEGEIQHKTAPRLVCVFVPTTPNPTSGMLVFVPREDLIYLDMTTEDGLKLVISGGVVTPPYSPEIDGGAVTGPERLDKSQ